MVPVSAGREDRPVVFFSYARDDLPIVRQFAEEFRTAGVDVLMDVEFLQPGEIWQMSILHALTNADALVAFISPISRGSLWVSQELASFADAGGRPIYPVLIAGAEPTDLPGTLARYQAVVADSGNAVPIAVAAIARQLVSLVSGGGGELSAKALESAEQLADDIAIDRREPLHGPRIQGRVFLVHGHDLALRDQVDGYLRSLGVEPVVLAQLGAGARSIVDKFETHASQASFAVVVLSADDLGASRRQFEDAESGGGQTLKYRARENVILEMGYFYGRLGWENVFVVQGPTPKAWPDFERPSDLAGVVFFEIGGESDWMADLKARLHAAEVVEPPDSTR